MVLSCPAKVQLLAQLSDDFVNRRVASTMTYCVDDTDGASSVARRHLLSSLHESLITKQATVNGFKKIAFDTRRFSQDEVRNPRSNLQYWHRSEEWIRADLQIRINRLARFIPTLQAIKDSYHLDPSWHLSYVRKLGEDMERILRIKEGDDEIVEPQIAYLEQLLDARYRLSLDSMDKMSPEQFKTAILSKDEELLKKGVNIVPLVTAASDSLIKTTDVTMNSNIVNAIFGTQPIRQNGEKSVTRTITITITDSAE